MKTKFQKYNVILLIAMVFAICYQSLHKILEHNHIIYSKNISKNITLEKQIIENDDCFVCHFEFAFFVVHEIQYFNLFEIKNIFADLFFSNSIYHSPFSPLKNLRGPPAI